MENEDLQKQIAELTERIRVIENKVGVLSQRFVQSWHSNTPPYDHQAEVFRMIKEQDERIKLAQELGINYNPHDHTSGRHSQQLPSEWNTEGRHSQQLPPEGGC